MSRSRSRCFYINKFFSTYLLSRVATYVQYKIGVSGEVCININFSRSSDPKRVGVTHKIEYGEIEEDHPGLGFIDIYLPRVAIPNLWEMSVFYFDTLVHELYHVKDMREGIIYNEKMRKDGRRQKWINRPQEISTVERTKKFMGSLSHRDYYRIVGMFVAMFSASYYEHGK